MRRLSHEHARSGAAGLHDLGHAAAGDDDRDVLPSNADDVSVGLHFPDREHADGHSVVHVPDSATLFPRDSAIDFSQGRRARSVVAADAGADAVGARGADARGRQVDEAFGLTSP